RGGPRRAPLGPARPRAPCLGAGGTGGDALVVRGRRWVSRACAARLSAKLRAPRRLRHRRRAGARVAMVDRNAALRALEELALVLNSRGIAGRIFVVGGAALALAFDARRTTRDIDAVFEPKTEVYGAAREVADRLDLP